MLWWHKGCTYAFFTQCIPIEVCEPLVLLHYVRTFFAQPVRWLSLDQAIDQVCSLGGPAPWDVIWMNLDLLGQDLVSNLFTVFSMIRSLAKHAFVGNYAHCKVVDSNTMILSAHHFWCHVARRAWRVFRVFWVPETSNTQICDAEIAVFIKDQILGLYVSMQNRIFVEVLQA